MILRIRPALGGYKIKNKEGTALASIRQQKLLGPAKLVFDQAGPVYHTDVHETSEEGRYEVMDEGNHVVVSSDLVFEPEPAGGSMTRPPRADRMVLHTAHFGEWEVLHQRDHSVLFAHDGTVLGKLSPFFTVRPQVFACSDKFSVTFWAALYVLAYYMVHEDEMVLV